MYIRGIAALVLSLLLCGCLPPDRLTAPAPTQPAYNADYAAVLARMQAATHYISVGPSYCSATAVGPHVLLTATHCLDNGPVDKIDGLPAQQVAATRDGADHVFIRFSNVTFDTYINTTAIPLVGETVYAFGAPGNFRQLFHKGYVSGYSVDPHSGRTIILFTLPTWFGDSGSAVFDQYGNIVAVESEVYSRIVREAVISYGVAWPLQFSKEQWEGAKK